jgi:AraC family transcriptional regulator of adaptative response / DNA-3-methyladenine glycosylase II
MRIDEDTAHAAVEARDRRFDGLFFTGVTSTGIYCRCVCPARTPKRENRRFFPTAAAAERAGFRPCLICRPERAPGQAPIDAAERLAHDALKRIEAGALEEQGLEDIAGELGVTGRHLRRVMIETFGAAPIDLAQTHRLLTAKRLLADTDLPMTEVAFASGFKSVRRFNALFVERYGLAPSRVRRRAGRPRPQMLSLRLDARGRLDPPAVIGDLHARQIAGVEAAAGANAWTRTVAIGAHVGWFTLNVDEGGVDLCLSDGLFPAVRHLVAAVRGALDLDADIDAIHGALMRHDAFAGETAAVRLPGSLDPFETAVRAVLGQQVTLEAGRTLGARLTERFGAMVETPFAALTRLFPSPERLANADPHDISRIGMPRKRGETIHALACAAAEGKLRLARGAVAAGRAGLEALPGVGPWTLEYVALRGLGDPDAFPLGDSALRAAFGANDLAKACEAWRPWRGYAAARLWRRHSMNERRAA